MLWPGVTILVLIVSFGPAVLITAVSVDEDLTLTLQEKIALDKFRDEVSPSFPENYMKEDIYLVRWLRARRLNINEAKKMLMENLQWRKANNMSTIQSEFWGDMEAEYPYNIDTHDKDGRPIVFLNFGDWDIRRAILGNMEKRLIRYLYKALDQVTSKVRELQKEGKRVTQWISLLDMDGYSLINNGCFGCIRVYISYVTAYESYFPGTVHNIILVNTPSIFEAVLQIVRPLLDERTKNVLHVFGHNKGQWQKFLLQNIDREQLERNLGGK